ncbi:MAG: tetratricopeptide repeat protein [Chitinophagales bacterium]
MAETKKQNADVQVEKDLYQRVEHFFLQNRNVIVGILAVIVIGIAGYFGYKKLIFEPKVLNAQNNIAAAQKYFDADSIDLALNGDGTSMGFLSIIDKYGNTPSGNLAHYYAGVCYMQKKELDAAIKQLESFDPKTDEIAGRTYELLGHAYADKGDFKKAISLYGKAGDAAQNNLQSPFYYKMAGDLMMDQQDYKGALDMYKKIKKDYPLSQEGQNIDLDIAYAESKIGA